MRFRVSSFRFQVASLSTIGSSPESCSLRGACVLGLSVLSEGAVFPVESLSSTAQFFSLSLFLYFSLSLSLSLSPSPAHAHSLRERARGETPNRAACFGVRGLELGFFTVTQLNRGSTLALRRSLSIFFSEGRALGFGICGSWFVFEFLGFAFQGEGVSTLRSLNEPQPPVMTSLPSPHSGLRGVRSP